MDLKPEWDQCERPLKQEAAPAKRLGGLGHRAPGQPVYGNPGFIPFWFVFPCFVPGIVSVHLKRDNLGNPQLLASPSMQPEGCGRRDGAIDPSLAIWHKCAWAAGGDRALVTWSHSQLSKSFQDR